MSHPFSFYTNEAVVIVKQAGLMVLPAFGQAKVIDQKDASPGSVVTELDQRAEVFLTEHLKRIEPGIEVVGEEFGGNNKAERFWLVDSIDGTAHFVRGNPFCTTMVALVVEGQVVSSCIYDFVNNQMYTATRGEGAFCNGQPIHVSQRSLKDAYLFWEINLEKKQNLEFFLQLQKKVTLMKTQNCGWEFAMIASGKMDGRICIDPFQYDWDYAPGSLLVAEAGGVVANIGSSDYDYKNHEFIVANSTIHRELKNLIDQFSHEI